MKEAAAKESILIVDDKPANLSVLTEYLLECNYRILTAESGERALEALPYAKPDLILLDVMMPGIDGFETCRRVKVQKEFADIPVIFMTALTDTDDKLKGFKAGAVDYLTKPLNQDEVMARINTHLTLHQLRQNLQQKVEELDTALKDKERLIGDLNAYAHTVAHDLKNPVGTICGISDTLISMCDIVPPAKLKEQIKTISKVSWKQRSIIDELLLLSSIRSETVKMSRIDMEFVIDQVKLRLKNAIDESGALIELPEEWPKAVGYGTWVEEVWTNFVSNAIKYGGTPPVITLNAKNVADGYIQFRVIDNGEGIDAAHAANLFAPYSRLEDLKAEGHGLGLSIVKRIVDKLGGDVGVESTPGKGSTFWFTLKATN